MSPLYINESIPLMPDLTGNRIFLREYTSSDLDMVHQWMSDSEVMKFLSWGPTKTRDETFIQLADFMRHRFEEDRQGYYWPIVLKSSHQVVGHVDLRWISKKYGGGDGSVGYFMNRSYWGKGYMTEAVKLVIDFGFSQLGMHKISASCIKGNIASEKIMIKCGMTKEAEYREGGIRFDKWVNRLVYAILDSEWKFGKS